MNTHKYFYLASEKYTMTVHRTKRGNLLKFKCPRTPILLIALFMRNLFSEMLSLLIIGITFSASKELLLHDQKNVLVSINIYSQTKISIQSIRMKVLNHRRSSSRISSTINPHEQFLAYNKSLTCL